MEKTLNHDINKLQNGIRGFYRTKRFKIRIAICILLAILILASAFVSIFLATRWNGKVIFLCKVKGAYNYFYKTNPDFLKSVDMSQDDFESKASVRVIYGTSTAWNDDLRTLGISGVDFDSALDIKLSQCYILLLDKKGNIVYQGTDASALANELINSNF